MENLNAEPDDARRLIADLRARNRELEYLLNLCQEAANARGGNGIPGGFGPEILSRNSAELVLLKLAAPQQFVRLAREGRGLIEIPWQQHLRKRPWRLSHWRAIRRLQRRLARDPALRETLLDRLD